MWFVAKAKQYLLHWTYTLLHQGEEVPAEGDADLGEALDGVDDDKDLEDEDSNTTEDNIALEPWIPLEENGKVIKDILDNINNDSIDNNDNSSISWILMMTLSFFLFFSFWNSVSMHWAIEILCP